ncbi:hypothetical protein B0H19DRAFT_1373253 [Mycena capillaripes]|nr:hypothetical protein B0H19DRAFT_1373253 [Mycena capillaripes]
MSDPSDPAPPVLALDSVSAIGPYFLGNSFNYLFMGALTVQTFAVLFSLELVETGFATHEAWYFSVENWGNFAALGGGPWTQDVHVIAVGVVSAIVQIFYAVRLSTLKKSFTTKLLTGLIMLLALAQCTATTVGTALLAKIPTQFELLKVHPVYSFWLVASFVTDILISGSMVWVVSRSLFFHPIINADWAQLYTSKDMAFTPTTNNLLDRLIINSVQTGGVTVACAGATLILFLKSTDTVYYGIPLYMLGKLYSNSLVATLNARNSPKRAGLWDPVELHLSAQADTASGRNRTEHTISDIAFGSTTADTGKHQISMA